MTLGKRAYPQGEMIGLGSGKRAGMIPAGNKGTMRVVSKFQSLSERLTIGKFLLGPEDKETKNHNKNLHKTTKENKNPPRILKTVEIHNI